MTTDDNSAIYSVFDSLWEQELDDEAFDKKRPLLAHYTSISTVHKVLSSDELWFSNPLLMNDVEEVRFSVNEGYYLLLDSELVANACKTQARTDLLRAGFTYYYNQLANEHILDTYVLCLSEHDKDDQDGLLSMWRGYGGNGSGAAIVFDTGKLEPIAASAFILGKVEYGTNEKRAAWINKLIEDFARLLAGATIPDDKLWLAAAAVFERLQVFALFSKHRGFDEEREWRVAYVPSRDHEKRMASMCDYVVGPRGVEPKLKFKVGPIEGLTGKNLSLGGIIDRVLLGPSVSSPLAMAAFNRMLDRVGKPELKTKVRASRIPFRALPN